MNDDWYYLKAWHKYGPVSRAELTDLFRRGVLGSEILIMQPGSDEWQSAGKIFPAINPSGYGESQPVGQSVSAPNSGPANGLAAQTFEPGSEPNKILVWVIALQLLWMFPINITLVIPLVLYTPIDELIDLPLILLNLIVRVSLIAWDRKGLKQNGFNVPSLLWALFPLGVMIYLFRRASFLGSSNAPAMVCLVSLIISWFVMFLFGEAFYLWLFILLANNGVFC